MVSKRYSDIDSRLLSVRTYCRLYRAVLRSLRRFSAVLVVLTVRKNSYRPNILLCNRSMQEIDALLACVDASRCGNFESVAKFERPVIISSTRHELP